MKKKITIIATTVLLIGTMVAAGYFLLRGTLGINTQPNPVTIMVDKKEYKGVENFTKRILIGPHKIVVKKDYYQDVTLDTWINLNQETTESASLKITSDGQELLKISREVTNAWIKYSQGRNSEVFLATVKPYLTTEAFTTLSQDIADSGTTNGAGVTTDIQTVSGPVTSTSLMKIDEASGKSTIKVTKRNEPSSVSSLEISFAKSSGVWKADAIFYNY